ncbi:MAG TPA: PTS sugar transporter subunit IIA [Thermoanaerobaculia bacterium]|jgi:PTS system mannose-specific IIA component|nr:PTS sugar transporter subunit IIA [Thermoanaerobaculia bacterium]
MIGKLILTHGGLARELLSAANVISGRLNGFEALSLDWSDGFDEARGKVSAALTRLDTGEGVLILTDMYGGTPCNIAMTFFQAGKVEVLTGVNLPMVLRLACQAEADETSVTDLARALQAKGQKSVCLAGDLVNNRMCGVPAGAEPKPK